MSLVAATPSAARSSKPNHGLKNVVAKKFNRKSGPLLQIERLVDSTAFEVVVLVVIGLSTLLMIVEVQYRSYSLGSDLEYDDRRASAAPHWPEFEELLPRCEWVFGACLLLEVVLRAAGQGWKFICTLWFLLDFTLLIMLPVTALKGVVTINPQILRMARLLRLGRVLRPLKKIQHLDSLILIMTSIKSSCGILVWTMCLLVVCLIFNSLLLNQLLVDFYFDEEGNPLQERQEIYRYFGSFTTALFSMFELTLANWPPISRMLYENVSEWFILVAILHKLTVGFALVGVINGVFMQETFRVAQQDDLIMLKQGRSLRSIHRQRMARLMELADKSGDDMIDKGEWRDIFQNIELKTWLSSMGFAPRDVDTVFAMMDDGSGALTIEEMIDGVANLQGPARNIDVQILMRQLGCQGWGPSAKAPSREPTREWDADAEGAPLL